MGRKVVRSGWMKPEEWGEGNYYLACAFGLGEWFKFPKNAAVRLWASQHEMKDAYLVELDEGGMNPRVNGKITLTYFSLDAWLDAVSEEFDGARSFYAGLEYKP